MIKRLSSLFNLTRQLLLKKTNIVGYSVLQIIKTTEVLLYLWNK